MAAPVKSITSGGGKIAKAEVLGIRNLRVSLNDLLSGVCNAEGIAKRSAAGRAAADKINGFVGEAAQLIKRETVANAMARRWPRAVVAAIFKYNDPHAPQGKKWGTALAGIRTGARPRLDEKIFREWEATRFFQPMSFSRARKKNRKLPRMVTPGTLLGISLARIYETGTRGPTAWTRKSWKPTYAFRDAVALTRTAALGLVREGYEKAIDIIQRAHGSVPPTRDRAV